MKLQDQCCTLEQAKKLKELGVSQISLFNWSINSYDNKFIEVTYGYDDRDITYSAFTVAELGVMLPSETLTVRRGSEDSEYANWEWENEGSGTAWGCFNTEAEARADHLIILVEKGLIKAEEVNQRLS